MSQCILLISAASELSLRTVVSFFILINDNNSAFVGRWSRYAYRENITELLVASFNSDHRTRIKCKSYIKKISVYKNRIAVQLPTQIVIYEFYEQASVILDTCRKIQL